MVGGISCLISEGDERMCSLLVGIDVSKNFFSTAGIDSGGKDSFTGSYSMDSKGFDELLKTIRSNCEDLSGVVVAMESTGCYHINLFSFLTSRGIRAMVVNPLLIANFAKLSLRKTKTDKKDAMTVARFVLDQQEKISQLTISQDLQDLRDLSRERESLSHLVSATKVKIKRVLRTTFPELEAIGDIYTGVILDPGISIGSSGKSGEAERDCKTSEGVFPGEQTDVYGRGYPSGSQDLDSHS